MLRVKWAPDDNSIVRSTMAWPPPTGHLLSTMVGVEITLSKFAGTERPMGIFPAQPLSLDIFSRKAEARGGKDHPDGITEIFIAFCSFCSLYDAQ